jgi:hypothetical protein
VVPAVRVPVLDAVLLPALSLDVVPFAGDDVDLFLVNLDIGSVQLDYNQVTGLTYPIPSPTARPMSNTAPVPRPIHSHFLLLLGGAPAAHRGDFSL